MTINELHVPVAQLGAILPGAGTPWASLSGEWVNCALPQNFSPAVVTAHSDFVTPRGTTVMAQSLAAMGAAWLPIDIRKQYVHKTRVNVGGGGAPGPHREREPA